MRRIDVVKIREILRLGNAGLSLRETASACSCGKEHCIRSSPTGTKN